MRAHSLHGDEAKRISEKNLRTPERLSLRAFAGPTVQRFVALMIVMTFGPLRQPVRRRVQKPTHILRQMG
ncbi:MAG: hypothetical protein ACREDM_09840 [Methylocella sp.]